MLFRTYGTPTTTETKLIRRGRIGLLLIQTPPPRMSIVKYILFNAVGELFGKYTEFVTKKDCSSANRGRLISVTHPNSVDPQLDLLTAELLIITGTGGRPRLPIPDKVRQRIPTIARKNILPKSFSLILFQVSFFALHYRCSFPPEFSKSIIS